MPQNHGVPPEPRGFTPNVSPMYGDEGEYGRTSSHEAPTEYIPRITDAPSPADAQTEFIPKIVYTPPPPSQSPDAADTSSPGARRSSPCSGTRSTRASERAARRPSAG